MMPKEWMECAKVLEKEFQNCPQLINCFSLIISLLFLFPRFYRQLVLEKKKFIEHLCSESSFWEIQWLKEYLEFRSNKSLASYLHQEDWWWEFLTNINIEKNNLEAYLLSHFHESLKKPKERKSSGIFLTPKNQIKVICHYALFYTFKNFNDITLDDKSLFQLIFNYKYPIDSHSKDNQVIASILSNLKILDPSCGTGLFLVEMNKLLLSLILANPIYADIQTEQRFKLINETFLRLHACDIDSYNVKLTRIILLHQYLQETENYASSEKDLKKFLNQLNIYQTDFLEEKNTTNTKYDIIIGNPPYVRHHGLITDSIKRLKDKVNIFRDLLINKQIKWDKKADLYIYFWLKSMTQIYENGVIAFVLSRAWLSSQYTNPLKQVFMDFFSLDLVLELPFEVWENAEIRTHIVVGHKINKNTTPDQTEIIVWKKSLETLLSYEIWDFKENLEYFPGTNISLSTKETDSYRVTIISNINPLMINSEESFPFLRLDYLTMSTYLMKLLIDKKDLFCLLKDLGKLEMGSTTGANRFFYLSKQKIDLFRIPSKYLYPMTKSPKEWNTIFSPSKELKYFLHIPKKLSKESPCELLNYINEIQDDILKRPYFKNKTKNNWYRIPLVQPEILIPNMIFKRSFVAFNSEKLHTDKQWIGFWTDDKDWLFFLLGFLNSTLGILLREIQGTRTLGLGSLKLSLLECQNLLVIDPRKMPKNLVARFKSCILRLGNIKIESIQKNQHLISDYFKIQNEID
ncbi:MAG: Eco57I restriction-modification methylase domain-containing protein, partial [Candidatus Thorarchaeota archaeon]